MIPGLFSLGTSAALAQSPVLRPVPAPPSEEAASWAVADPVTHRLGNGLDVVIHPQSGSKVFTVQLILGFGEYVDPQGSEGLGAMTLDLVDEATTTLSRPALAQRLNRLGASVEGRQVGDTSELTLTGLSNNLDAAVALWADVIRTPAFDRSDFALVRARHLAAAEIRPEHPHAVAWDVLWATRYGSSYVGRRPSLPSLRPITVDGCHALWRERAGPANAVVLAAGDVDAQELIASLEAHLSPWQPEGAVPSPIAVQSAAAPGERIYAVDFPGLTQAHLLSVQPIPPASDPDHIAFEVALHAFGGALANRVNQNLGLLGTPHRAMSCGTIHRHGGGHVLCTGVIPSDRVVATIEALRSEWFGVLSEEVLTPDEIARAADALSHRWPGRFANPTHSLELEQAIWRYGLPEDRAMEYIPRVREVDAEQANAAFRSRLNLEHTQWVVIADLGALDRELASTGILVERLDRDGHPTSE